MDQNQLTIQRYISKLNQRNFAVLEEILANKILVDGQEITREQYKQQIQDRIDELPDYQVQILKMESKRDKVILNWKRTYSKNNQKVEEKLISEYSIKDGKALQVD